MATGTITLQRVVADRGPRPRTRGWAHGCAALIGTLAGTVLTTFAWMTLAWHQALAVTIYSLGVIQLFGVSALYHLGKWKSSRTVQWWRRADHATIALFIAATYTPLCIISLPLKTAAILLTVAWIGAIAGVVLNLVWIEHPRWIDVVVYLTLGWLVVPVIPQLWSTVGPAVIWLLAAGGVVYSFGAFMYGLKWPGRQARYYGYHEHFHTATVIAAVCHHVAMWMVVVMAPSLVVAAA